MSQLPQEKFVSVLHQCNSFKVKKLAKYTTYIYKAFSIISGKAVPSTTVGLYLPNIGDCAEQ